MQLGSTPQFFVLFSRQFLRVDEHNSGSYIGRDDFFRVIFSRKVSQFVQAQIYFCPV